MGSTTYITNTVITLSNIITTTTTVHKYLDPDVELDVELDADPPEGDAESDAEGETDGDNTIMTVVRLNWM